jgi:type I restriction enzyme R subunit
MNKKSLSEQDIRTKYITPAIVERAGWDRHRQMREEYALTAGRIYVRGKLTARGKRKIADYVLFYKPNIPIAVVEAKDNNHDVGAGMQQALGYAEMLDVPFVYSSNGDGFVEHDRTRNDGEIERFLSLNAFPNPAELWTRYRQWKGLEEKQEKIILQDYFRGDENKSPRYYQLAAINRTIEAIAKGRNRILLAMATGTGKTFTAFQIIWRLWKSGSKKRILFLADRNVLVDQTKTNDFAPFGNKMTKITGRQADKAYEVYLSLYQALTGPEEAQKAYKKFSKDFFDLIIIDECHRGSAAKDSAWREILEYFSSATQIGLTATPKETKYVSNIHYFGDPVFMYSLKQGIDDGFLAPYKVIRVTMDKDDGWRPESGQVDRYGYEIPDDIYNLKDFDRNIILSERTKSVSRYITQFLKKHDRFGKTIVFCENIEHAEHMRQGLVNENADLVNQNSKYVMRITGDSVEGKQELDNFILPWEPFPVIATTSKLMTTGIDAKTCKLVVLDRTINSMTEFKQIIGRGTRIDERHGKRYFTIIDFRRATNLFADPDFDGDPENIYEPRDPENPDYWEDPDTGLPEDEGEEGLDWEDSNNAEDSEDDSSGGGRQKYYIDDVEVSVVHERVQYLGVDGKLITESLREYSKKRILQEFRSLNDFIQEWNKSEQKKAIVIELEERGVLLGELQEKIGEEYDPFDLICHVAFDRKPLTRSERARKVRDSDYFVKYGETARLVLDALLDKYAEEGIENLEEEERDYKRFLENPPFSGIASPFEIIQEFGGIDKFVSAIKDLEQTLYVA